MIFDNINEKLHSLEFTKDSAPKKVLIFCKPWDDEVLEHFVKLVNFINVEFSHLEILVEQWVIEAVKENNYNLIKLPSFFNNAGPKEREEIDYIITLGGDGTILWACKQFHETYIPPLITFSHGSLGYLCNFTFEEHQQVIKETLCPKCRLHLDNRLRLKLNVTNSLKKLYRGNDLNKSELVDIKDFHVINEVVIDRGPSPYSI